MMLFALHVQAQGYHYDVNNDGAITIADVVSLVNKLLGKPDEGDTSNNEQRKLILRVSENPLISPNGAKANKRLAPAIFTNTLDHFYINMMYYHNDKDNEEWSEWRKTNRSVTHSTVQTPGHYENNSSWPTSSEIEDDGPVTVFGYYTYYKSNVDFFELNYGNPYLQVVTEESSDDQRDVLVAKKTDTWNNCQGVVNLVFNHVCAALQFSLIKTSSLADYSVEVKEVKLHNVHDSGKYDLLNDEWYGYNLDNNYSDFTLNAHMNGVANAITVSDEQVTLLGKDKDDYLFLIPQTITGMAKGTAITTADTEKKAYLEIKCKIYDSNNNYKVGAVSGLNEFGSVYLPFSATLNTGHIHPFIISIGTAIRDAQGNKIFN